MTTMKKISPKMSWQELVQMKRVALLASIPSDWLWPPEEVPSVTDLPNVMEFIKAHLSPSELLITESPASKILYNMRTGEWTAEEVVLAFSHRSAFAHQLVNCLSEVNFEDAIRRAKSLDEQFRQTKRTVGPLHGLPIVVTDRFNIEGLESACGYVSWLGTKKSLSDEGILVERLKRLGVIIIAKTNVPMSMLLGDTSNNIIGTTLNPYNRGLSPGGASGGTGALVALRGAPCGVGNEMAGSLRIPCAFNNLYGLKPSEGRIPAGGLETSLTGLPIAPGTVGFMSPDSSTLNLFFKSLLDTSPWKSDPNNIELPWRDEKIEAINSRRSRPGQNDGKLVFGILLSDDSVQPAPAVMRALQTTRLALLQLGHEVIEWKPPSHSIAAETLFKIFGATSGQPIREAIDASGEPVIPQLKEWYENDQAHDLPTKEFWDLCAELRSFRWQYHEYWTSTSTRTRSRREADGVVMPVAPQAAVREGEFRYHGYTAVVNALDYTAACFPVLFADRAFDVDQEPFRPLSDIDSLVHANRDDEGLDGAPVGLQIMCQRLQEEKTLALVEVVNEALAQQ